MTVEPMPVAPDGYAACRVHNGRQSLLADGASVQETHLVRLDQRGSNGGRPTVCGLTRFDTRDDANRVLRKADLPGWSMHGGGVSGPGVTQHKCWACWDIAAIDTAVTGASDGTPPTEIPSPPGDTTGGHHTLVLCQCGHAAVDHKCVNPAWVDYAGWVDCSLCECPKFTVTGEPDTGIGDAIDATVAEQRHLSLRPLFPHLHRTFERNDTAHVSRSAANQYIRSRGWNLGESSVGCPSAVSERGRVHPPKWRHIPRDERETLVGILWSEGPYGPNTLWLREPDPGTAPAARPDIERLALTEALTRYREVIETNMPEAGEPASLGDMVRTAFEVLYGTNTGDTP